MPKMNIFKFLFQRKRATEQVKFDFASAEFEKDPHPYYRQLRDHAPVYWSAYHGSWLISRYKDVTDILSNHADFSSQTNYVDSVLHSAEPPAHTTVHQLLAHSFSKQYINRLSTFITDTSQELIDSMVASGQSDIVSELARPLSARTLCKILGIEAKYAKRLPEWAKAVILSQVEDKYIETVNEFDCFLRAQIKQCRSNHGEGMINQLIKSQQLSSNQIISVIKIISAASVETTSKLIGNLLLAFLQYPDLFCRVQRNNNLIPNFVNEVLRYYPPVSFLKRMTKREIKIGKMLLPAQAKVTVLIASANRDADYFEEPNQFKLERKMPRQMTFGYGIHYCLGARLAELEAKVVVKTLLSYARDIQPVQSLEKTSFSHGAVRGPERLDVSFIPR